MDFEIIGIILELSLYSIGYYFSYGQYFCGGKWKQKNTIQFINFKQGLIIVDLITR